MQRITQLVAILSIALWVSARSADSQFVVDDGRPPVKERSPELRKLDFMVGTWDTEAINRYTPDAKEFRGKMITTVQWSPNGQFLISDEWALQPGGDGPRGHVPPGWLNKIVVTTWNPIKKDYTLVNILANATYSLTMDSLGAGGTAHGETNDGDHVTETWTTFQRLSDTETKFRTECSIDHGPKWVYSEGVSRKRPQ